MSQVFCASLDDLAVLELQGGQPDKLLQGQITADMKLVTPEQALPGLLCSLKGRVISSFEVVAFTEDHLALILPADNLEAVQNHLKKYEPFFKTRLVETTDQYQLLGLSGKETPALLASLLGAWPKTNYRQAVTDQGLILHLPGPQARGLVLLKRDHEDFTATLDKINHLTETVPLDCWRMLDIQVGRAQVNATLTDQYLPQMLNYQALGAVSFKKGCYPGQEVVARMHYRGTPKRRTARYRVAGACPVPGSELHRDDKEAAAGQVVNSAPLPDGDSEVLAVVMTEVLDGRVGVRTPEGHTLTPLALPYTLDDPEA